MDIEEIIKFAVPIVVSFFAAHYGSRLAIRKFKKEKLWDERRAAYKEIIESFEEIIHWAEQIRANHFCEPEIGGEANFDESLRKISKYSKTGSLFFANEFYEILVSTNTRISQARFSIDEESKPDLDSERNRHEWYFILSSEIRKIVEESLPKLISSAKNELPKNITT